MAYHTKQIRRECTYVHNINAYIIMVQMLRKENKSYSFTDFGDLLLFIKYLQGTSRKRTIYLRKTIVLIGSDSREENKSYALQITNVFSTQIIVISS